MLLPLINNDFTQNFCSYAKKVGLVKGAKVCGVDLKQDYLNFKLYLELMDIPSTEIAQKFLGPNLLKEFQRWTLHWDKNRKSGLAFGIKVDTNNVCKKYFHVKFNSHFNEVIFPEQFLFLRLLRINLHFLYKGISYEIQSKDEFYQKFYVYIKDPIEIMKVLSYKNMASNLDVNEIEELELYATKESFKINIINKMDNFSVKQDVWKIIPNEVKSSLEECARVLDCDPVYAGVTSSGAISAYFSFTKKPNNILNI